MFLNVMTPLIMVISFADSMQLTFAARDRLIAGESKYQAFRNAVLVVGPACVLTHATAGISFIALMFSSSDLIRTFGEAGLIATVIALLAVLTLVPLLGVLLIRNEASFAAKVRQADFGVNALRRFCAWIAARMVSRPGLYSLISLLVVGGLAFIYATLEPRYRLADQVPDREQAVEASEPARRQAHRRQPDRRADRVPERRLALCARDARRHRRRACDRRGAGRRRQRLVAGDAAALAAREGRHHRRRDAQAICRHPARAPDAPLHLGRTRTRWSSPAASRTSTRASSCRSIEALDKSLDDGARRRIPAIRSP